MSRVLADRIEPAELEGRTILIGLTRMAVDGSYEQEQHVGVATVNDQEDYALVEIACEDGERRNYPLDGRSLQRAAPGKYRLRSTGQVVTNPDFLMSWTITKDI